MKSVAELRLVSVWLSPEHLVSSARILLDGHRLRALGVVDNGRWVGVVTSEDLSGAREDAVLASVVREWPIQVGTKTPIREVAERLFREMADFAVVVEDGRFFGVVTATMLLGELVRVYDPLTNLPWSDSLRQWGIDKLKEGAEITLLFLDIDDFGLYNKRFGHVVGDRVLQKAAQVLQGLTDPDADLLVRYGGDEFAIISVRDRADIEALQAQIERRIAASFATEAEIAITFSVGVAGGRRTRERENIHYMAMLDNLINMASRLCQEQKAEKQARRRAAVESPPPAEPEPPKSVGPGVAVLEVHVDELSSAGLTSVLLGRGDSVSSGVHVRGDSALDSVVAATAKALEKLVPGLKVVIQEVALTESGPGGKLLSVAGVLQQGNREDVVSAVRRVGRELYLAAAETVVQAVEEARV
ncbi:MAG: GGDEF domain-containing protein [Fimbriimonadaceae bacterium]